MTMDDRLERAIRTELERRAPGPAPARLRARLAAIPNDRRWPLGAVVATAAVLLFVAGGAAIAFLARGSNTRGAPGEPSPIGGPAVAGPPDAPWLPLLPAAIALVALASIGLLLRQTNVLEVRPPARADLGLGPMPRRRRVLGLLALIALILDVLVLAGALLVPGVGFAGGSSGYYPAGFERVAEPEVASGGSRVVYFHWIDGQDFATYFTLRNLLPVPVRLTGWRSDDAGPFRLAALRLPPTMDRAEQDAPSIDETVDFRPIELSPGMGVSLVELWRPVCVAMSEGVASRERITLTYDILGLPREEIVEMPAVVAIQGPLSCTPAADPRRSFSP